MDKTNWYYNLLLIEPQRIQFGYFLKCGEGSLSRLAYGYVRPFIRGRTLEIGCGTGWLKALWHIRDYTGTDHCPFREPFQSLARAVAEQNGVIDSEIDAFCRSQQACFDTLIWYESAHRFSMAAFESTTRDLLGSTGHVIIVGPKLDVACQVLGRHLTVSLDKRVPCHLFDHYGLAARNIDIVDALEREGVSRKEIVEAADSSLPPQLAAPLAKGVATAVLRSQLGSLRLEENDFEYRVVVFQKPGAAPVAAEPAPYEPADAPERLGEKAEAGKADNEAIIAYKPPEELVWIDARKLPVEGKAFNDTIGPYDRLPARIYNKVPYRLWTVSRCSTGLNIRFNTDSPRIDVSWKSITKWSPHMPPSGLQGVDLYARAPDGWRWVATGMPNPSDDDQNSATLVSNSEPRLYEYMLYFPLCSIVVSLRIGISSGHELVPAPAYPSARQKPLCFYGTSFTQGASASRAGMAYPSLIGRWLDMPVINLGFSGCGRMEPIMVELLSEIDCALYILDCIPNMSPKCVRERLYPFVVELRARKPDVPILLVDNPDYQDAWFSEKSRALCEERSTIVTETYNLLRAQSYSRIDIVPGYTISKWDGEASVGNHSTDLGFMRTAEAVFPHVRSLLA